MRKHLFLAILLTIVLILPLSAQDISFKGGSTRMKMQEGSETMLLENGAEVQVGSLTLRSTSMELYGKDFRFVSCEGDVTLQDEERGISLVTSSLLFDRTEETLLIDSWGELEDSNNQVAASAARMEFFLKKGIVLLQVQARLLKHTDEGPMICRSDFMTFDRDKEMLDLKGRASIVWKPDTYEAQTITVNLKTEEIRMEGSIKGTIHG
jgi:lipopolysaccharide export system protein LptA